MDINRLFERNIKKASCVSFDVFDTLIKRNVAVPTDVFRLMEHGKRISLPRDFARLRVEAERQASKKSEAPVSLHNIYEQLKINTGSDDVLAWMEEEIRLELDLCYANQACVDLFNRCVAEGKKVILISDMYLPQTILRQMLNKCGVLGYEKIYISCECAARKSDASLFNFVLKELGIPPKDLVHIGDNWRSDYLLPATLGIHVHHIVNHKNGLFIKNKDWNEQEHLLYSTHAALASNVSQDLTEVGKLGCTTLGPLLWGFTLWLRRKLKDDNIRQVYFMSREGCIMQQAFALMETQDIQNHYLYCSRRAYTVPLLWQNSDFEAVFQNITIPKRVTLREFLFRIGLEPQDYAHVAQKHELLLDAIFENDALYKSEKVRSFYKEIWYDVKQNSKQEYDALLAYIREANIQGRIAVVDIGRHGTMQNALQQIANTAGLNIEIYGYYVGVAKEAPLVDSGKIKAYGYLHERGKNEDIEIGIKKYVSIFESIFLAQHGSVKKFEIVHSKAYPVLYPYEYILSDGKKRDEISIIQEYQNGALQFVAGAKKAFAELMPDIPPRIAIHNVSLMGTKPTLAQAALWGDFRVFDYVMQYIAFPERFFSQLKNPQAAKRAFMQTPWKIGYMKRLLKIPFPYERLYNLFQRLYKRHFI